MRRLLFAAAFLLCAASIAHAFWQSRDSNYNVTSSGGGGGGNQFTLVAHTSAASSGPTTGINTAGANLIVITVSAYQGNIGGSETITDSKSNTWTKLTPQKGTNVAFTVMFYCISPTVGAGHTFTFAGGGTAVLGAIAVQAWSDGGGTPTFDVQNGAVNNGSVTSIQPGSVTPSFANSLVVSSFSTTDSASDGATYSINTGFTISDQVTPAASVQGVGFAYLKETTITAVNPTWTSTLASDEAATIAVFKP